MSDAPKDTTIDPYYFTPEWIALRISVVQLNKNVCSYCGCQGFQADHVIPRSKGGEDAVSNLVCACARCNALVGGKQFESFAKKKAWIKAQLLKNARPPSSICTWEHNGKTCSHKKVKGFRFCAKHLGVTRCTFGIKGAHPNRKRKAQR